MALAAPGLHDQTDHSSTSPAFSVQSVEPTGAGDAFTAAIISRLIANGWSALETDDVRFASAAGALTTTRSGAIDSLPSLAEVKKFLEASVAEM